MRLHDSSGTFIEKLFGRFQEFINLLEYKVPEKCLRYADYFNNNKMEYLRNILLCKHRNKVIEKKKITIHAVYNFKKEGINIYG